MDESLLKEATIIFVLGGPGSGKGTQCSKIAEHYGFSHLSVGDLLRAEEKSGSENCNMIKNMMNEGKLAPSDFLVKLLKKAMVESGNDKFLIDGFPRSKENLVAFNSVIGVEPKFVIYLDCSKEVMVQRSLSRNQGRKDDNIDTINKRLNVFFECTLPVVEYYEANGKLQKINGEMSIEEVFEEIKKLFLN